MQGIKRSKRNIFNSKDVDLLVKKMMPLALWVEKDFNRGVAIYGAGFLGLGLPNT